MTRVVARADASLLVTYVSHGTQFGFSFPLPCFDFLLRRASLHHLFDFALVVFDFLLPEPLVLLERALFFHVVVRLAAELVLVTISATALHIVINSYKRTQQV